MRTANPRIANVISDILKFYPFLGKEKFLIAKTEKPNVLILSFGTKNFRVYNYLIKGFETYKEIDK